MTPEMLAAWLVPLVTIGTLVWRLSAKLTSIMSKLDHLEEENRRLRADLVALQTLLSMLVDKRATRP